MNSNAEHHEQLERATSARLAKLAERDVDTRALEAKISAALAGGNPADSYPRSRAGIIPGPHDPMETYAGNINYNFRSWLLRAATVAAVVLITWMVAFFPSGSGQVAVASSFDLTTLHHDLVGGRIPAVQVTSIDAANSLFASQRSGDVKLPANLANAHVESCCLADVQGELASIAVLELQGQELTLVVAEAPRFAHRMGEVIEIDGHEYFGHAVGGVQMMMSNRGQRWLCVMGDLEPAQLADIASQIEF